MKSSAFTLLTAALLAVPAAAQKKNGELPARTEAEILKTITLPEGFEATVFALPPMGGYPTSVSAAIDGTIFVAIDENGSLGRDRNPVAQASSLQTLPAASGGSTTGITPPRIPGKVVRMRDTDGDGRADEFRTFCEVESPRGVIWDAPSGIAPGTLYVMHPPNLTAYTDTDGDGKSDKQEDILTGLGFGLDFRGADHTTNGCRLAIDGFIYIAVGDYGFVKARAKDGTTLTNRGGGIVRIRPDGTGFEIVSRGQRNIYDVAVSPTLDLFTRDNTNDGGGWNVRLSFVPPGAHLGYPYLFKNFPEDMLQPLADLGGGSPCGALWMDEPGLPKGLFTVEWGAGGIMYHDDLVPDGAGWKVSEPAADLDPASTHKRPPVKQNKWIAMTRPTDMDVDATGALFITSWEGATFNYNGPNAGYVLRVVKKGAGKVVVPDLGKATPKELLALLSSPSATIRLAAQRRLLASQRRFIAKNEFDGLVEGLQKIALGEGSLSGRIAALATMIQTHHVVFPLAATELAATGKKGTLRDIHPDVREAAVRFCGEDQALAEWGGEWFAIDALSDANPRVRAAAITAMRRLWLDETMPAGRNAAPSILPLVADADRVVAHLAVRALSELKAIEPCLAALDAAIPGRVGVPPASSGVPPEQSSALDAVAAGALRALYGIYQPAVVDGLIERLRRVERPPGGTPGSAGGTPTLPGNSTALRRGILNALCRLANQDAPYTDPKVWWGTRPDTSGPVYQPIAWSETPKITAALKTALEASNEDDAKWLVERMYQTKVAYPGLIDLMLAKAGNDTPAKLTALEGMFSPDNVLPAAGLAAAVAIVNRADEAPELRARAMRLIQRGNQQKIGVEELRIAALDAAVAAFSPLAGHPLPHPALTAAYEDFTRAVPSMNNLYAYENLALGSDAGKRTLAQTILVNLATSTVSKGKERDYAQEAVKKLWDKPEVTASLLGVIAQTKAKSFAEQVKAHLKDPNNAVAEAALFAYQALGLTESGAAMPLIGAMKYEEISAAVQRGGDAKAGQELYLRAGCIACHTVSADEPPKGPVLSAVAKIYDRAALTESLLKPNAKLAQGFESVWIKTKKGEQLEGFVTREGGDNLDLRNIAGQTVLVEKADIAERGHRDISMMPDGLLNAFTPTDLMNLLAWLESLNKP